MFSRRCGSYCLFAVMLSAGFFVCFGGRILLGISKDPTWIFKDEEAFFRLVIGYPVIEELAFRGVIQGWLLRRTDSAKIAGKLSWANGITSLLFVAVHFVHHTPVWAAAVWIPSLMFGYVREYSGSVVPAVILHGMYNLFFYALLGR